MKSITRRGHAFAVATVALMSLVAAGSLAVATAASGTDRTVQFRDTAGAFTNVSWSCGAIETVTVAVHGIVFFDENGTWVRTLEHASHDSVLTGPTGTSIPFDAHQNAEFTADGSTR